MSPLMALSGVSLRRIDLVANEGIADISAAARAGFSFQLAPPVSWAAAPVARISLRFIRTRGAPAPSIVGPGVAQQPRADETHGHHHSGAEQNARRGPAGGEAVAVNDRADRLTQIEKAGMQRRGGTARGVREVGDMHLDRPVQQVEAETEEAENADLPQPREL